MRGLPDKRVLISGGSSGIGQATAQRFLEEGARVFLCGLDPDEVDAAVAGLAEFGTAAGIAADVSRDDDVTRLVDSACAALGGIDVLINNAGIAWREPFLAITAAHWDRIIAVNLRGMFLVAQAPPGCWWTRAAVGSSSTCRSTNGLGGEADYAHYNASKAGMLLLTKTMAVELGPLWHSGQRPVSRIHRDATERRHQRGPRRAGVHRRVCQRQHPAGPPRPVIGGGSGVRLPGLGRRVLHHRRRDRHRRWATRGHVSRARSQENTAPRTRPLEECAYHVGNAVLGIEHRDPPPFVEGRARMRDAQADLVAGREPGPGGN